MDVRYHPLFERWLTELAEADEEIFGEVMALLSALEIHVVNSTTRAVRSLTRS